MRLVSIAYPAHETIRGVQFAMLHMGELVHVLVSSAALDRIETSPTLHGKYTDRFNTHRERLEVIADQKFTRGHVEDDGSITVDPGDL